MATRQRRTPVLDQLKEARAAARQLAERVRRHNQVCSACHTAGPDTAKLCDEGWELAKLIARSNAALRRAELAATVPLEQGTLW